MPTCKKCNRKGLFLSLNKYGICNKCWQPISFEIDRILFIMRESYDILLKTKNIPVVITRADTILENINDISRYVEKGIDIMDIEEETREALSIKNGRILTIFNTTLESIDEKVKSLKTSKAKINKLNKTISQIHEIKELLDRRDMACDGYIEQLSKIEGELREQIREFE